MSDIARPSDPDADPAAPFPGDDRPGRPRHTPWLARFRAGDWRERTIEAITLALFLLPGIWLVGNLLPPLNHDAAAILYSAERWLEGSQLYVDVIDVNPPLIFILSLGPALAAKLTGYPATVFLVLFIDFAIVVSFLLCRRVLDYMPLGREPLMNMVLPAVLLFLMAVFPDDNFAQREHVMLVLAAPYVLLAGARADGDHPPVWLRVTIAILAGIGFGIKPHFVLIPAITELYVLRRTGWRDLVDDFVPWTVALVIAAHVAIILAVTPAYLTVALPLTMALYPKVSANSALTILTGPYIGPTILFLSPLVAAAFALSHSRLVQTVAIFAVGAIVSAVAQGKGWAYQSFPALAATLLLGAVLLANLIDRYLPADTGSRRLPVAAIGATFMLLFYYQAVLFQPPFRKQREFQASITARLGRIIEREAPNHTVLSLSPGIYPFYPMLNYTGARQTQRFLDMWALQGIYADCDEYGQLYNPPDAMSPAERFIFRSIPDDFAREKPDLLIIDRVPGIPRCQDRVFSYLDYFQRNPVFAKALTKYEWLMDLDRYVIYRRKQR